MDDESAVKVCVRVRPLIQREQGSTEATDLLPVHWKAEKRAIHQVDEGCITKTFNFDRVFSTVETTKQLYQEVAKPLVVSSVQGYNGTIFAYGQTSSGKTFTMMGSSHMHGVIPLAMEDVFQTIKNCPKKEFLLRVSYMEIYNETVTDLLCDSWKRKPLEIREGNYKNVYVADLTEELVTSADQALAWIRKGEKNRHYGKTKMNQRSSRSHTIFRMILESRERSDPASGENADGAIIVSHLNLVDLAGAERASQTGAEGARLKEGCNINRSLFTLGQVIKKLSEESQGGFTNYRDSKLTRILQNSLGGNAKTVIICTITPATVDETLSTLQFASTAKRMKNDPHVTEVSDDGALLRRYRNEIVDLKRRLEEVSTVTRTAETEKEVLAQLLQEKDQLQREQEDRIRNLTNIIVTSAEFVAVEKKVPKRRMTWGGKLLRPPLEAQSCADSELSFAEPSLKRRRAELQSLAEADEAEGDEFDSRWGNLEQPGLDGDMNQSNVTIRSFYDGELFSSPCLNELSEKVAGLELQLKIEAQEKQVALETKAALESRLAEVELKKQEQVASLEVRLAELEAEVLEKREAVETRAALEGRLAKLEAEVLEKREAMETRAALEGRLAELEAEVLEKREAVETRAALEVRLAELEAEVLEKREAVETRAALEVRLAELEAEVLEKREAVETRAALEVRLAELEAEVLEKREAMEIKVAELQCQLDMSAQCLPKPSQEQYKKDLGETIQLCEALVSEKEAIEVQRNLAIQECVILKEENRTLSQVKESLLREVQEKQELEEFSALEQESTKQYETELKDEIARLQSALQLSLTRAAELEAWTASLSTELKQKDERIKELQNLSGKDLVQQVEELSRSLSDAEGVSRDAKRDWAVLRSEKLGLQESVSALTECSEKLKVEVQTLRDQQRADKVHFKKMEADLQRELQGAFEETAKLTALLDGKVPRSLTDNIELERQVSRLKKELELAQEEVKELSIFRELPVKVEQLMQQIGDLTQDLCSCRAEKEALVAARETSDANVQKLIEDLQQAQVGLERAVDTEAELGTIRADAQHWAREKEQILESLESLKQEAQQRQEGESSLKHKLAEQQQLVTDLQIILTESQETSKRNQQAFEQKSDQLQKKGQQLEEELEELKAERSQLRRDLEENAQLVQHRIEEFEELRSERDQLKGDLQENVEMMIENQEELRVAQEKIRGQQKCIQDLETQIGEMKSQLMRSSTVGSLSNVEDLKGQIQQLDEELQLVQSERDTLLSERTDSAQGLEEKLEKLHLQVTSITQERDQLQEVLEALREERNQLKKDLQENLQEAIKVQDALKLQQIQSEEAQAQFQLQVQQQAEDMERLKSERGCLEDDLQKHVEKIQQLGEELQLVQSERDALLSERTDCAQGLEEKLEKLHSQVTSITQERDQLQEMLEGVREERNQLKNDIQENIEMLIMVQEELRQQQQLTSDLQAQALQRETQQSPQQSEELDGWRAERNQLKRDLQENVEMMIENQEELRVAQEKIRDQQSTIKGLETRIVKMRSQLIDVDAESRSQNDTELKDLIQQLSEELQLVQNDRDALLSQRKDSAQKLEEKLENLHSQVTSITQERDQLQEILEGVREERNQLKNNVEENVMRIQQLGVELQVMQCERDSLLAAGADPAQGVEKLHSQVTSITLERDQLQEILEALREERNQLKNDVEESVMRVQQLGIELQVMQSERDTLLSERTDSAQGVEKLHAQVTSITQERDQLQEVLEALGEERNQLKKDLQENLQKAIKVQDALKLQQIQSEEAQAQFQLQVQQQAEDMERLKSERGCLEDDLQKHVEKIQQLGEELQLVQSERDALLSERTDCAQGLEEKLEKLHSQVTSITQERDQLQEMLEGVREERNQLKNGVEENVVRIQQLGVELQVMQSERDSLLSERTDSAQGVEKLHSQVTSITQERDQLQEVLEALREERNQLKNDLQDSLEKVLKFQDELQHQKTLKEAHTELQLQVKRQSVELDALREERTQMKRDLQENIEAVAQAEEELQQQKTQNEEAQTILQLKVKQLEEELEGERQEVRRFKKLLDEASAKLLPETSQRRSAAEESRPLLYRRLEESESLLQGLLDRCQLLREQALGASTELMAQLDESSLVQNELIFRTLLSIPKATRQIYGNFRKNTDHISGFVCHTAGVYGDLAAVHRQQFEAQARHDLACMEEMCLQDLLLQRVQGPAPIRGPAVLQLQDLWDQRASELLEKRQGYIQKLQSILGDLESGLAQNSASVQPELAEQRRTNEELRPLCDGPAPDSEALEHLLQRELSRRAAALQPRKELYQRLQAEYFQADTGLQVFKADAQRQLMKYWGSQLSPATVHTDRPHGRTDGRHRQPAELPPAGCPAAVLQARLKPLEENHEAACDKASKLAQKVLVLKQLLQDVQTQLEERQKAVESLEKQLQAQVRKGVAPGTEELEEMKAKLFRMELEQSAQASSYQEKVSTMTALLDHKEDTLRKLKEMLRKVQNQGDESFIAGGLPSAKVSSGAGAARLVQSTAQLERAKLESDMKHLQLEVERLESLVSSQKEDITKWKGRAMRLKETQRDLKRQERPSPAPLTPSKRGLLADTDAPSPIKKPADRSGLPGHEEGNSTAPPSGMVAVLTLFEDRLAGRASALLCCVCQPSRIRSRTRTRSRTWRPLCPPPAPTQVLRWDLAARQKSAKIGGRCPPARPTTARLSEEPLSAFLCLICS
ncbi:centromere-associated protein E [Brienomyrus brachyistius]|uniref:centromere-associated protein E n=1 Tax=Brienomyrus brachyistius TaxID=42636 RepID=UPI0020B25373|nr:centromere-associated protein E [Brienomyrus brachyistius]